MSTANQLWTVSVQTEIRWCGSIVAKNWRRRYQH